MSVDFQSLLAKPAEARPPALPSGTFNGMVTAYKYDVTKGEKQTPYVEYSVQLTSPGADIAPEDLEGVNLSKRLLRKSYYLTPDAQWRIEEFCAQMGIEVAGRPMGAYIPEAVGQAVLVAVTQRMDPKDPKNIFNDIATMGPAA